MEAIYAGSRAFARCTHAQDTQDKRQAKQDLLHREADPAILFGCRTRRLAKQGMAA